MKSILDWADNSASIDQCKLFGDLILANLYDTKGGQAELICQNVFSEDSEKVVIPLNASLTAVQNAQNYYRHFAKARNHQKAAALSRHDAQARLKKAKDQLAAIENAHSLEELKAIKRGAAAGPEMVPNYGSPSSRTEKGKLPLLTLTSSDGWLIYVGRNRKENDQLLSRLSRPFDIWLHLLGEPGAHVLIKVPSSKQEPPLTTIKEAAYVAARFSRITIGSKVRVVYTQSRFVKRAFNGKPGVVQYENEKTIEVDTGASLPEIIKQLF
jgi:predicted ribosome quality control (RQC) complex YloA/Tae2 family protein